MTVDGKKLEFGWERDGEELVLELGKGVAVKAGEVLVLTLLGE